MVLSVWCGLPDIRTGQLLSPTTVLMPAWEIAASASPLKRPLMLGVTMLFWLKAGREERSRNAWGVGERGGRGVGGYNRAGVMTESQHWLVSQLTETNVVQYRDSPPMPSSC